MGRRPKPVTKSPRLRQPPDLARIPRRSCAGHPTRSSAQYPIGELVARAGVLARRLLAAPSLNQCKRDRLATLRGLHDLHREPLPLANVTQPRPFDNGDVDEHILLAIVGDHKTETFIGVEPLDDALDDGGLTGILMLTAAGSWARCSSRSSRWRSAGIHLKYRGDLRALLTLPRLDAELGPRRHLVVPGALQDGDVQERIARAVSEFNEAEALLRIEPRDGGIDHRTFRGRHGAWRSLKCLVRAFVVRIGPTIRVVIKSAAPPISIPSFSHLPPVLRLSPETTSNPMIPLTDL